MKRLIVSALLGTVFFMALPGAAAAQSDPEATLFIGYSYLRPELGDTDRGHTHGAHASYTYYLDRRVGFTLSVSGHWGSVAAPPNIFVVGEYDVQQVNFLAGPHLVLQRGLTAELGFELLAGAVWRKLDTTFSGLDVLDESRFAFGGSLTLDVRVGDHVWVRLLEPSVIMSKFGDEWRPDYRVSIGLQLRSGEILQ